MNVRSRMVDVTLMPHARTTLDFDCVRAIRVMRMLMGHHRDLNVLFQVPVLLITADATPMPSVQQWGTTLCVHVIWVTMEVEFSALT